MVGGDSGSRSYRGPNGADAEWPQTPDQLVYQLDLVLETYEKVQRGEQVDLLEELLACADWREMFGSEGSGFLTPEQIGQIVRYYREKFSALDPFYLAEQLSTELMTALMVSGDIRMSEELQRLGRERPHLWQEIRTFFSRKELATALLLQASRRGSSPAGGVDPRAEF